MVALCDHEKYSGDCRRYPITSNPASLHHFLDLRWRHPVFAWRPLLARAREMEFADDDPRTEHHKREDIAQDFGWMVGVVRYHTVGLHGGCVSTYAL
jgi:hypothetical protein